MRIIEHVFVVFVVCLNGLIMSCGWVAIFLQNLSFLNLLMSIFEQNLDVVCSFVLILSFSSTIITFAAFIWALRKIKILK